MNTFSFHKLVFALLLLLESCNFSDSTRQLGDGYFFRNEGGKIKDILCEDPKGGEVPATVIAYGYDENFIIAKQKPKLPQDALYDNEYNYKKGSNAIYYWIVIKDKHSVLGPLAYDEYQEARNKFKIPDELKVE